MTKRSDNLIRLQDYPGGAAAGLRSVLDNGRQENVTAGPNPEFSFIGSDPYGTNSYTGLVVPPTPSSAINDARYLMLLARASFSAPEKNASEQGIRLIGIRQYAELIARIPAGSAPLSSSGPQLGSTVTLRKEIKSPLWHPFDGNISWHVMVIDKVQRDRRNPSNTDGFIFQDSLSPALLYQVASPYSPPNGGRPWGTPLAASLGNIHDLRYPWRTDRSEVVLDIPIPAPCDVVLFASVRQNNPATNPSLLVEGTVTTQQFFAASDEDQFVMAYPTYAQYGVIAGSLVFNQNIGENVP